jgi:hypothetical protein
MHRDFTRFNNEPDFTAPSHSRPYSIGIGQFYITNVCNLACDDCISFNNFRFQGHLSWADSRERVEAWARLIDIDYLCIIGGEPMANPELPVWVENLRRLWPRVKTEFSIVTNGTYLSRWDQDQLKDWMEQGVTIEVSVHDPEQWPGILAWADGIIADLEDAPQVQIDYRDGVLTHSYCLDNGARIIALGQHWMFGPSAVRRIHPHGLEFHDSDPATAHRNCPARLCHYFVNGIMYKCPITATAAMLTEQFAVREDQRQLLQRSRGLDPLTAPSLTRWFTMLDQPIAQCRLCPEYWPEREPIWPLKKRKPEVARISLDSLAKRQAHPASPDGVEQPRDSSIQDA